MISIVAMKDGEPVDPIDLDYDELDELMNESWEYCQYVHRLAASYFGGE